MMRKYIPYILFLILVLIFLREPIFKGKALLPGDDLAYMTPGRESVIPFQWNPLRFDAISQFYPWRVHLGRCLRAGKLPEVNPYQFNGTPFIANGQSAVFYPPNLIFIMKDTVTAFTIFAALHLFAALCFTFWFALSLGMSRKGAFVSSVVFAFGAFMIMWLELPTFISAAVWLPMTLFLTTKYFDTKNLGMAMLAGCSLALAFLAGHLQIAFYVSLGAGLWFLYKIFESRNAKAFLGLALFVLVSLCVASPQIVPSLAFSKLSHRVRTADKAGYESFIANRVEPFRYITAFCPYFYGSTSLYDYCLLGPIGKKMSSAADEMEDGMYCGIPAVFLAVFACFTLRKSKNARFFAALFALSLLMASGTFLNAPFYYLVPGFSALGGPNRILLLWTFSLAVLAGFGFDEWSLGNNFKKGLKVCGITTVILLLTLFIANIFCFKEGISPMGSHPSIIFQLYISTFLMTALTMCLRDFSKFTAVFLIILTIADLHAIGFYANPTCDRRRVFPETELVKVLKREMKPGDVMAVINPQWSLFKTPSAILPGNSATVYGLHDAGGYDSLYLRSYKDLTCELCGEDTSPAENGNMLTFKNFTPEMSKIANIIVSIRPVKGGVLVGCANGVNVFRLPGKPEKQKLPKLPSPKPYLVLAGLAAAASVGCALRGRK